MPVPPRWRSLVRHPALSLTVVGTLAIGIAALATTFGVVHAALFRQPPFPEAGRLAMLFIERRPQGEPPRRERWSFPRFEQLRKQQQSFESLASYSPGSHTLSGTADAELVQGERVSAGYFQVLQVSAARGRLFSAADDDPGQPAPVVLLGHALWSRRWAADSSVLGRSIRLNGVPLTVIGILPAGFTGLSGRAQLWIPRSLSPQVSYAEYLTTNQNFISAVGRLRPGVTMEAAQAELAVLGATINRALPSDPDHPEEQASASAVSLNDARVNRTVRRSLYVLLAAVALLHLLACANVINLLLGRAASRRRESTVRVALGSSAGRLFRHILGEGMLLAGLGAGLGVLLAAWGSRWIAPPTNAWAPRNFYGSLAPFDTPAFGLSELGFAALLAIGSALLVALPPALTAFRLDIATGLKAGTRGIPGGALRLRRPSARGVLVGIEATLAMLLVVAAGLLVTSFRRMRQVDLGVDPANLLTFWVIPSEARVPPAAAPAFVARLLEAVRAAPGVVSASVDGGGPLSGTASSTLYIEGRPAPAPGQAPPVLRHYIAPEHFATMGIPVERGRTFTATDVAGAPRVAVISEGAARKFWPNQEALGQRVWFGGGSSFSSRDSSAEIVGIVRDVVYAPLDTRPNPASFYTPYAQFTYASRMVFVRTEGSPLAAVPAVRRAVAAVDPDLAIQDPQPLGDIMNASWARNRFDALLFGGFGIAALLLAASGIFAVLSHTVAGRTREFGVRIALGADAGRVLGDVLREGMAWPVAGVLAGVGGALAVTRLLQASLYETSPQAPGVYAGTAALLLLVAAAACLVPAWRATRVDAMEALRAE